MPMQGRNYTRQLAAAAPSPCVHIQRHQILGVTAVTRWFTVKRREECEKSCLDENCPGCIFRYGTRDPLCTVMGWIKEAADGGMPSSIESWRCRSQLPQENGDYPGLDLANVPRANAVECSYACEGTAGCFAYTWSSWNGGVCFMKTEKPSVVTGPYDGSLVSGEAWKCGAPRFDEDIVGADLAAVQRPSWPECCGVCRRTSGCKGFLWSAYNGGTCWLKAATSPTSKSVGVTSGSISQIW